MKSLLNEVAIYELIKKELNNLPGEKAHLEMIPYRTVESLKPVKNKPVKNSAVLCLLSAKQNTIQITLIERTKDGSPHSGQISFPGGKLEKEDKNLEETALRETHEEIGISPNEVTIIGKLSSLYIPVSNFHVTPFIGFSEKMENLKLSEKEVHSVFSINLSDLLNPGYITKKDIPNHLNQVLKNVPCFFISSKIIWGATALILNEVKIICQSILKNQA